MVRDLGGQNLLRPRMIIEIGGAGQRYHGKRKRRRRRGGLAASRGIRHSRPVVIDVNDPVFQYSTAADDRFDDSFNQSTESSARTLSARLPCLENERRGARVRERARAGGRKRLGKRGERTDRRRRTASPSMSSVGPPLLMRTLLPIIINSQRPKCLAHEQQFSRLTSRARASVSLPTDSMFDPASCSVTARFNAESPSHESTLLLGELFAYGTLNDKGELWTKNPVYREILPKYR